MRSSCLDKTLGVGFIGSGFITRFHIRSWQAVRGADVRGVWSPTATRAEEAAALARSLHVGEARAYPSIAEMVADPSIDCIWLCGPNYARVGNMEEIVHARTPRRRAGWRCVREAAGTQRHRSAQDAGAGRDEPASCTVISRISCLLRGSSAERTIVWARGAALAGRPYLARAAEEHGGPHMPWFWRGDLQGGGVLNDMMCHSLEVGRFLLTKPGAPRHSIRPVKVSAQIATLKWSRPEYVALLKEMMGASIDYGRHPGRGFRACVSQLRRRGRNAARLSRPRRRGATWAPGCDSPWNCSALSIR